MRYVVSDVHGHLDDLRAALGRRDLVDGAGRWSGGDTTLWFLGDFFDRGPDGVGVVDLVMRLQHEAPAAGGAVRAVLGNHEILAMGMHRFGARNLATADGRPRSFAISWAINGGRRRDQERLTTAHLSWLARLPALARDGDFLLMHSDTTEYLGWGESVDSVNATVADAIGAETEGGIDGEIGAEVGAETDDLDRWWDCWRRLTTRYAFATVDGVHTARQVLRIYGGARIVHGHSIIASLTGQRSRQVRGPLLYADGLVLAVDGGRYDGGPLLVVRLDDYEPASS